jgi:hypothetical protein
MSPKDTQEDFFHHKLSETAVPDWREGWQRLEPRLPHADHSLRRSQRRRRIVLWAAAAVGLLLMGGFWALGPGRKLTPSHIGISTARPEPADLDTGSLPSIQERSTSAMALTQGILLPAEIQSPASVKTDTGTESSFPVLSPLSGLAYRVERPSPAALPSRLQADPLLSGRYSPPLPVVVSDPPSPPPSPSASHAWHFALRLNANGASSFGAGPANTNPLFKGTPVDIYPSAYVAKSLSGKVSLQLGLAVASPVDVRKEGLNRSVPNPMRAMATGVSASQDSINFSRLYYADIPLTLQYHLSDRFTIGSGLQISVLEKAIGRKQQLDYNADGLLQQVVPEQPQFENIAHDQAASGMINPVDVRMVWGLHYRLGEHWNLSVQYQYGFTDISKNRAFLHHHVNRNQVLQTSIGFRLK